ncbi:Fpg/Nei family DNA glycosylase [Alicyclobacillus sp. ALC3]|uniref:Fpg/Nei family DNA glycosylase n=1 Tax=Alicyclobacillus sp. ALC3 TaxID=2796143 RepID=UPI002379122C|nr:DNA-formamidopyrimidine glycosylase family protein [Alicyclobacillus sp. ALC3]WDL99049.1 Fpg/Nei family DNA glycosylase [Alicyclobacillus sp. ALC3]
MPELPEMENYRRRLVEAVRNHVITDVEVNREKSVGVPVAEFVRRVNGRTVVDIVRRAKHLVFALDSGDALLLHLMLGGSMHYGTAVQRPLDTCQVIMSFGEQHLYFVGLRLGYLHLLTASELRAALAKLGLEPFDPALTPQLFTSLLTRRSTVLKVKLTDQHVIAGIGNRYSDEICFAARVLPLRKTGSLSGEELAALYRAMHTVLEQAIAAGGYMASPFSTTDTTTGGYNGRFFVYNRGGEACRVCGMPIVRTENAGRKVFYCEVCQH